MMISNEVEDPEEENALLSEDKMSGSGRVFWAV